jgi:hypothetical protein
MPSPGWRRLRSDRAPGRSRTMYRPRPRLSRAPTSSPRWGRRVGHQLRRDGSPSLRTSASGCPRHAHRPGPDRSAGLAVLQRIGDQVRQRPSDLVEDSPEPRPQLDSAAALGVRLVDHRSGQGDEVRRLGAQRKPVAEPEVGQIQQTVHGWRAVWTVAPPRAPPGDGVGAEAPLASGAPPRAGRRRRVRMSAEDGDRPLLVVMVGRSSATRSAFRTSRRRR